MSRNFQVQSRQLYRSFLFCLLLVPLCAARDWRYEETHNAVRDFVSGGNVHVRLSVGDLRIKRGDSTSIKVQYTVKSRHESSVKDARVDFNVRGNDATLEFHAPHGGDTQFDVDLEIPAAAQLDVHQRVGDITVDSIDGDKDLNLGVGDTRISTEQKGYRFVNVSTGIGDVNSHGYGETRGWLGKSLKYHGDGKHELRAHVGVGDIKLEDE